jgi:hypothetical protein
MKSPVPTAAISMSTDNLTDCFSFDKFIFFMGKSQANREPGVCIFHTSEFNHRLILKEYKFLCKSS